MQGDWSNATTVKFLELYEAESSIWDAKDKNHKLKHKVHGWMHGKELVYT